MLRVTKRLIEIVEKEASKENSANKAREVLRQGADITAPTYTGSMIDYVIAEEQRQRLIRKDDKANNCLQLIQVLGKEASNRLTAQVLSANGGNLDEMYRLVQLKADCYQSNTFGPLGLLGSLLTQVAAPIQVDIVRFLIENDSQTKKSLTVIDDQEQTTLSLAKKNSKCPQDVINYLQRQLDEMLNQIPFVQPPINPNTVIVWIRRGANIEATDKNLNTVLSNAVIADNVNLVRVLLTAGSNTTHKNADGLTPLQIAEKATSRNLPLIALLKEQNIDAELKQLIETKRSRLTIEEIQHLLANGAKINAKFANNDSPLHLLITNKGTPEMITAFVNDFHADVSATNANGYRPIETCILQDKDPFARLLAFFKLPKISADLFTNSKLNKTLLQFAIEQKRLEAANIIQNELNLHLWNCMARANAKEENNKTITNEFNQLLTYGAQINHKHQNEEYPEWTVLHLACKTATQQLVQHMIKSLQADYTLQNHNGDYPICIAAEYGHLSIMEYLCHLPKSSINVFNRDGQTPLHLATKNHHLLVVRYLVKWGADHQARNLSQQTPIDIARENVSKNKEEEINNKKIILFFEQLICPSTVDPSPQQSNNTKNPTLDLDTCELVAPVTVNPIDLTNEDTEGPLGDKARGIFSGTPNENLHDAAKHGHVAAAEKAIGQGAIIHHRRRNRTPYEVARHYENKYTQQLYSTTPTSSDYRPLQMKIAGCQRIAGMLQQIAQIKLIEAIQQSDPLLVKSYHLAGAILTADLLHRACHAADNVQIVHYLINQDGNIYQALINDSSPNCPYRITKTKKFIQLSTYLKYRLSLECTKAIKQNNLQLVKKLVLAGASVDMQDTNNLTDILQDQNLELIQFLCDSGAKIPSNWFNAKTILLEPTLSQQLKPEVVYSINRCLINRRLRFAAANGDLDGVIQCQRLGADIDSTNCYGSTALLCTIEHGNYFRIVHGLVSCGASMLHSNEDQPMSLITIAKNKHYQQIDNYLSNQLNKQFFSSILDNNRQSAENFAKLGAIFDCQDEQERTPLHYAVQHHGVDLVSWLCEYAPPPTKPDIYGDYPITLATEKGDYAMVKFFLTKYPTTKTQTNKAGLTPLQIAQKHKFTRIAQFILTGEDVPDDTEDQNNQPKHDRETLIKAIRNCDLKIIHEFTNQRYESREEQRKLCYELIQIAKQAKQLQIVDILQPYYEEKLKNELQRGMDQGSVVTLNEHYKKILLGSLQGLSTIIANCPNALDPADPQTFVDFYSCLTNNTEKRSEQLQQINNEQDFNKFIQQDQTNTKQELAKIQEELQQITKNKSDVQDLVQDLDKRLVGQEDITALQKKELTKQKENYKQQLATYESTLLLVQHQQQATLNRQKTISFFKDNSNLIMFYQTIENRLQALFHSVLAAQGGYLQTKLTAKSTQTITFLNQIPLLNLAATSIKAVIDPVLSKINEKEQKKEWLNIYTLGNIEELTRIASDTAGILTLYYREQIQIIDPWTKIKGSNAFTHIIHRLKQAYDVRPETSEQIAIVIVAEYITTWIIDSLKLGKDNIDPNEPLPQQLWLSVARKDPIQQEANTKIDNSLGISIGQLRIPLKITTSTSSNNIEHVQLRYLIGCVSVLANGHIYQYQLSKNTQDTEIHDLERFGYVYLEPFTSDKKVSDSIIHGRQLIVAKRDPHGNILTRCDDIKQLAQTYASTNDQHLGKSPIIMQTTNQVAQLLKEQHIFIDSNDLEQQLKQARQDFELNVDVLREDIQEKTSLFQTSIDAAHEQIILESEKNRENIKKDNQILYDQNRKKLEENIKQMEINLQQFIQTQINDIQQEMQHKTQLILTNAETARDQAQQANEKANQAIQMSQQMRNEANEAAASAKSLLQLAEQQRQEFISKMNTCEAKVKETADQQKLILERNIKEIRIQTEQDSQQTRRTAQESADKAQQSLSAIKEIQKMTKNQLDKTLGDVREARQSSEKAAAEAREAEKQARKAADAGTTALDKVNRIQEKIEKRL